MQALAWSKEKSKLWEKINFYDWNIDIKLEVIIFDIENQFVLYLVSF